MFSVISPGRRPRWEKIPQHSPRPSWRWASRPLRGLIGPDQRSQVMAQPLGVPWPILMRIIRPRLNPATWSRYGFWIFSRPLEPDSAHTATPAKSLLEAKGRGCSARLPPPRTPLRLAPSSPPWAALKGPGPKSPPVPKNRRVAPPRPDAGFSPPPRARPLLACTTGYAA